LIQKSCYRFYEFARYEWLGDVEIAAAIEHLTFVFSQRNRGDGDDRDHLGQLVGLELAHGFKPGDVRKPYVQNNQIGMMLTCQVDRCCSQASTYNPVALKLQHIVQELKAPLVIFDDQDRFQP
jgi:hypothetical protein